MPHPFDLWIDGINVLCDSGTYSYASELGTELIAIGGHNTVKAKGFQQMTKHGAFMLCGWTKREGVQVASHGIDVVDTDYHKELVATLNAGIPYLKKRD